MKVWQKIVAVVAFVACLGLMGFTVLHGWAAGGKGSAKNITLGLDLAGGVSITYQAVGDASAQDMSDVLNKLQQRVQAYDGAQVYLEGNDKVTVEIPGASDANEILEELGKPGSLYFILEYGSDGKTTNYELGAYTDEDGNSLYGYHLTRTIEEIEADGTIILTGNDIKDCNGVYINDNDDKKPVVEFALYDEGAKKFADATGKAYENNWTLGVYYDGEFVSVPSVDEGAITGGQGIINGMSSLEDAKKLASYIRIGALPVELEEVSSKVVGATLGQEAISTSVIAGIIGFAILFIFMIAYYRVPGLAANIALAVYTGAMLLILNVFDLTLTLPGIAGIVLGIGMAVDANVIIYARIREEISSGMSVRSAIKSGFKKALSAIVDGNVTTLIAAVVLGIIGTGPVRGFALTLGIGIVLSMFTSLVVARWALILLYHLGFKKVGMYGRAKSIKTINAVGKRKICFSISGVLVAIGIIFIVVNGAKGNGVFNFDLEFSGGTSTSVTFDKEYTLDEVESDIIPVIKEATGVSNVQQQIVKESNTIVFKTQLLTLEQRQALNEALEAKFGIDTSDSNVLSSENIGGTISSEMRRNAIIAVAVATVCMLIYIWVRFRDVKFATSAIIALLHDVLIVLAFYAVSRTPVGNTFIACMLTILGYSINATIVIFDRIRENMAVMQKSTLADVVNTSITSTLSRSINTSLTTFVMVLILYIMGVTSIREFAAPIMVGIVCGAYSSVFISGALWFIMKKSAYKRAMKKAE
ncbi:MAG: protein translocase subunit SecD [Butyrivibrio sp.]